MVVINCGNSWLMVRFMFVLLLVMLLKMGLVYDIVLVVVVLLV